MIDKTADQIINEIKKKQTDVKIANVTQNLSAETFDQQKAKHLSHGGQGGVIGIILTLENKVVLAHRSKLNSGWSLPGGTVETGETFEETFKREIQEEVGIEVFSPHLVLIEKKCFISPAKEELDFVLATYVAHTKTRLLPPPTADALLEGLTIQLFDLNKLPNDMIFADKTKVETYAKL